MLRVLLVDPAAGEGRPDASQDAFSIFSPKVSFASNFPRAGVEPTSPDHLFDPREVCEPCMMVLEG